MSFFKKLVGSSEKAPANSKDKLLKELQRNMPLLTVEFMKVRASIHRNYSARSVPLGYES